MGTMDDKGKAMTQPIAFFCRAKPQGADAFDIFKEAKRVFIGYPLWRKEKESEYDPRALRSILVDPTCPDDEWYRELAKHSKTAPFTRNRNLARAVSQDSIVAIPRPERGVVHLARVKGSFEVVNAPSWAKRYLSLRVNQGLEADDEDSWHVADVAQGWPVDGYQETSLASFPGWMRRSMFGRSTYGRFSDHPLGGQPTAYAVLNDLLDGRPAKPLRWTLDREEIKRRLVETLTANAFEHLVVSLLQLEYPHEIWHQTGGTGDGGIDGLGSDEKGKVVGLMQAKFSDARAPELSDLGHQDRPVRRYAAVLMPENPIPPADGTKLLDIAWVTDTIQKHWRSLPLALAMRIGEA